MDLFAILAMAVALGTDSFSVCLGIGTTGIRLSRIIIISLVVGIFHVFMPLIGLLLGELLGKIAGSIAGLIGAIILLLLGGKIVWESLYGKETQVSANYTSIGGIFLLALSVSLDALSIGFSLGTLGASFTLALGVFGLVAFLMSGAGLLLGRRLNLLIGQRAEFVGGIILMALGLFAIFRG